MAIVSKLNIFPKPMKGGGAESEGELIEVVEMSIKEANDYISSKDVQSPPAFLFGVLWFLTSKIDRYR